MVVVGAVADVVAVVAAEACCSSSCDCCWVDSCHPNADPALKKEYVLKTVRLQIMQGSTLSKFQCCRNILVLVLLRILKFLFFSILHLG